MKHCRAEPLINRLLRLILNRWVQAKILGRFPVETDPYECSRAKRVIGIE